MYSPMDMPQHQWISAISTEEPAQCDAVANPIPISLIVTLIIRFIITMLRKRVKKESHLPLQCCQVTLGLGGNQTVDPTTSNSIHSSS